MRGDPNPTTRSSCEGELVEEGEWGNYDDAISRNTSRSIVCPVTDAMTLKS
jgi:hypothetical protein